MARGEDRATCARNLVRHGQVSGHNSSNDERRNAMRAWISSRALVVRLTFLKHRCRVVPVAALLLLGASALGGCASSSSSGPVGEIPITDFRMVAGRWTGYLTAEGRPRQDDDLVDLTIGQDGAYAFAVDRKVGPFVGKGQFVLKEGKLVMDGARGRALFTLLPNNQGRRLRGDAVQPSGGPTWVDLLPAQ